MVLGVNGVEEVPGPDGFTGVHLSPLGIYPNSPCLGCIHGTPSSVDPEGTSDNSKVCVPVVVVSKTGINFSRGKVPPHN